MSILLFKMIIGQISNLCQESSTKHYKFGNRTYTYRSKHKRIMALIELAKKADCSRLNSCLLIQPDYHR